MEPYFRYKIQILRFYRILGVLSSNFKYFKYLNNTTSTGFFPYKKAINELILKIIFW